MIDRDARPMRTPRDLPQDIALHRDLWPAIARAITATPQDEPFEMAGRQPPEAGDPTGVIPLPPRAVPRRPVAWRYGLGLAATLACLATGIWIGRASAPRTAPSVAAAFAPDARFGAERQALLIQASLGLATLPAEDRRKVEASLTTIRDAIADIRRALGDDPGNRLLQEMLVNSYHDEIRVLTAVTEAGAAGQEI